jgi:ionotropic kainate glutamate receptor 2
MWNFMSSNLDVFVRSTDEGIARVKKGGYAYLLESTMNEYARHRDCELMQVGGLIDTKGYGIGTPTGSPWRDQISNAILQLQENGDLQELHTKWWEKEGNVTKCDLSDDKKKDSANELGLANVGGVFVVLALGLCLSFLVAFLEFVWKAKRISNDDVSA